jgi:hypothetical protein
MTKRGRGKERKGKEEPERVSVVVVKDDSRLDL